MEQRLHRSESICTCISTKIDILMSNSKFVRIHTYLPSYLPTYVHVDVYVNVDVCIFMYM